MKMDNKQIRNKKDYDDIKDTHKDFQQKKVVRSWGLATRLENKKLVKPKKKKEK